MTVFHLQTFNLFLEQFKLSLLILYWWQYFKLYWLNLWLQIVHTFKQTLKPRLWYCNFFMIQYKLYNIFMVYFNLSLSFDTHTRSFKSLPTPLLNISTSANKSALNLKKNILAFGVLKNFTPHPEMGIRGVYTKSFHPNHHRVALNCKVLKKRSRMVQLEVFISTL